MTMNKKILAITPIACTMLYLLLGFTVKGNAWWWGLCIFLLIPAMPYILRIKKIRFTVPFIITITYIVMCVVGEIFSVHLWHPGWLIFFLIPIIEILRTPTKDKAKKIKDDDNVYEAR